jgi:hypothetical protein
MSVFQMGLNDYPHFNLAKDGRLCSTGRHYPGFLRVLYDALIRLGYDGDASVYHCQLSTAHVTDQCEVSVTIPFNPTEPWSGSVIGSDPDTAVELMVHIALTSLCETTTPLLQHCLSLFFRFRIRRTPYGSSVLRPCPTSRAQVRAVPVQPSAQHRQDRHAAAYASNGVQGESHCRHPRDGEAEA